MRFSPLLRVLFILYCVEIGTGLVLAPWSPVWDKIMMALPWEPLRIFGLYAVARAAVTGFGLIHLVWGAHDLDDLLFRRRVRAPDV